MYLCSYLLDSFLPLTATPVLDDALNLHERVPLLKQESHQPETTEISPPSYRLIIEIESLIWWGSAV